MKYIVILFLIVSCSSTSHKTLQEHFYKPEFDKNLNYNLDIAFIYHEESSKVNLNEFKRQLLVASEIFAEFGINIHLTYVKKLKTMPRAWHEISVMESLGKNPAADVDFYDAMDIKAFSLTKRARKIFDQLIDGFKGEQDRTIFVLGLNDIYMSYYQDGKINKLKVGALSFPGYIFGKRIPRHLRGVITSQNIGGHYRTLAHELGHKLLNVSHEGLEKCPKFSGNNIPGLMGYGDSLKVYGGKLGRFHKERLLRSPFLYKTKNGLRLYNTDYKKHGIYRDPIYDNYYLYPAC